MRFDVSSSVSIFTFDSSSFHALSAAAAVASKSHPESSPQLHSFLSYYLPTTLKILNAYDRMDAAGISGENIDATKKKVEQMMATISQAFDRQLDALFGDEALDISTDITVMEQMLQREGLGGQKKDGDGGVTLEL